jgi:uncharacterized protein Yka (UPF0111/DUF47 family)
VGVSQQLEDVLEYLNRAQDILSAIEEFEDELEGLSIRAAVRAVREAYENIEGVLDG